MAEKKTPRPADVQVGKNLVRLRGVRSQAEIATEMRKKYGHAWSQATVWNIETGARPLRFVEANDLSQVLKVPVTELLRSEDAQKREDFRTFNRNVEQILDSVASQLLGVSLLHLRCKILYEELGEAGSLSEVEAEEFSAMLVNQKKTFEVIVSNLQDRGIEDLHKLLPGEPFAAEKPTMDSA